MSVIRRKVYTDQDVVTKAELGGDSLFVVVGSGELRTRDLKREAEEVPFETLVQQFREKREKDREKVCASG